jgi:glycosyltransferase involved in cell wall biosynthesis
LPITVAPNGIDLDAARGADAHASAVDIVSVGRFLPHKRFDLVLETVARLRREGHPVSCRIIGDGPGREGLHALAADLRITDAVDFRHDVDDQVELYAFLKAGRVFLAPSEREGFGIAVLEALACGLEVVTTTAPDNLARHLVERSGSGTVCEPTLDALANAVRPYLAQPYAYAAAETRNTWIEEYDWAPVAARVREACMR